MAAETRRFEFENGRSVQLNNTCMLCGPISVTGLHSFCCRRIVIKYFEHFFPLTVRRIDFVKNVQDTVKSTLHAGSALIKLQCKKTYVIHSLSMSLGYESRAINIAGTEYSTLVLPKLLLRAESITEVRAVNEIRQLLSVIDTEQLL